MLPLLFIVHTLSLFGQQSGAVFLWGEAVPTEVRLGDVVFMEISAHNRSDSPVKIPVQCSLEAGTLSVEISDREECTTFHFFPDGCPMGGDMPEIVLDPGQDHVVALLMLRLPRLDWTAWRFWNPQKWRAGDYELAIRCGKVRGRTEAIHIDRRPDHEMAALLEFYDGGYHAPVPPGWDWYRPTLGVFGLPSFPLVCSLPKELAPMEEKLSPGSLRDIFHATRLTAAVYDGESLQHKRKATRELVKWLDEQHEIKRRWLAMRLVSWGLGNKGLGHYRFEFVDQVIPHLPGLYMRENWREKYRRENDSHRQWYLEHLRRQEQSAEPTEAEDSQAASGADKQEPAAGPAGPSLTPAQARLIGNIRAAGGEVRLPGRKRYRPWKSSTGKPGFEVRLSGKNVTAEAIARLSELGNIEYLMIEGPEVADESLSALAALPGLRELLLRDTGVSDSALEYLQSLRQLERLELGHADNKGSRITSRGLVYLQGLPSLRYLYLTKTHVDDVGFDHLSSMSGLWGLDLSRTDVTSEGLKHLKPLRHLRMLRLYNTQVDDQGLEYLQPLTELRSLDLCYSNISDDGLASVAHFTELENLGLSGVNVTDVGMKYLSGLKRLRKLTLHGCGGITDKGLEYLKGLTELRLLGLAHTEVTDAGLKHLEGLKNLQDLDLMGTSVSRGGLLRLRQVLPHTRIKPHLRE